MAPSGKFMKELAKTQWELLKKSEMAY